MAAIEQSGYDIEVIAMCPNYADFEEEIEKYLLCKDIIE